MATRLRAAILDDYQNVALRLADWSALSDVDIKVFTQPFASRQAATDALQDFEIVVGMRPQVITAAAVRRVCRGVRGATYRDGDRWALQVRSCVCGTRASRRRAVACIQ